MRLAIVNDVYADVHALQDALAQIERLESDAIACADDVLDWGSLPEETIHLASAAITINGPEARPSTTHVGKRRRLRAVELAVSPVVHPGKEPARMSLAHALTLGHARDSSTVGRGNARSQCQR